LDCDASHYGPIVHAVIGSPSCRVVARLDLNGDHGITVSEVGQVWFDPDYLTANGHPTGEARPLMQQTGICSPPRRNRWCRSSSTEVGTQRAGAPSINSQD
jgi:hypothetical protein